VIWRFELGKIEVGEKGEVWVGELEECNVGECDAGKNGDVGEEGEAGEGEIGEGDAADCEGGKGDGKDEVEEVPNILLISSSGILAPWWCRRVLSLCRSICPAPAGSRARQHKPRSATGSQPPII